MNDQPDTPEISQTMANIAESNQKLVAGVVNPPAAKKYNHWTTPEDKKNPKTPDAWLAAAKEHKGSWWPDWDKWVKKHAGGKDVPARQPGSGKLKVLCDAPGTYVKVRSG